MLDHGKVPRISKVRLHLLIDYNKAFNCVDNCGDPTKICTNLTSGLVGAVTIYKSGSHYTNTIWKEECDKIALFRFSYSICMLKHEETGI